MPGRYRQFGYRQAGLGFRGKKVARETPPPTLDGQPTDVGHQHDDRYYRKDQVERLLAALSTGGIIYFPLNLEPETVSTTTYTLVLDDAYKHKRFTHASGCALTVPPNSAEAFEIGTRIRLTAVGAGDVVLTPGSGVTLNSRDAALTSGGQYAVFEIEKVDTDEWDCLGDLTT